MPQVNSYRFHGSISHISIDIVVNNVSFTVFVQLTFDHLYIIMSMSAPGIAVDVYVKLSLYSVASPVFRHLCHGTPEADSDGDQLVVVLLFE